MNILCVIPARYSSSRLPGKPLADIAGQPMIQRVYERAAKATLPTKVLVATDHELVKEAVLRFGGEAVMTASDHPSGTDRLAEVAGLYPDAEIIVNVQGDEPLIEPTVIDELAQALIADPAVAMATLATPMRPEDYDKPSAVKVVTDLSGFALYFSRSRIPYPRQTKETPAWQHMGIYAYRRDFLLEFAKLSPTPLEQAESLEQLRALENGYRIKVLHTDFVSIGVDTPEDLENVNALFRRQGGNGR